MTPRQARHTIAFSLILFSLWLSYAPRFRHDEPRPPSAAPSVAAAPVGPDPAAPGPRDFWVARQALDPSLVSRITTDMVELRTFPSTMPLPDPSLLVQRLSQVDTKVLIAPMSKGELLVRTRFAEARSEAVQRQLRDVLANGMRAISVDVDALASTAGFVNQGDVVDVIATYSFAGRRVTRIVLQSVEVLARGSEYRLRDRPTGENIVRGAESSVFTLRVTPEMAVKVAHLTEERGVNRFRLVLKNRDDRAPLQTSGARLSDVLSDTPTRPGQPAAELAEIEIYRGANLSTDGGLVPAAPAPLAPAAPAAPGAPAATPDALHAGHMTLEDMADHITAIKSEPMPEPQPVPGPADEATRGDPELPNG